MSEGNEQSTLFSFFPLISKENFQYNVYQMHNFLSKIVECSDYINRGHWILSCASHKDSKSTCIRRINSCWRVFLEMEMEICYICRLWTPIQSKEAAWDIRKHLYLHTSFQQLNSYCTLFKSATHLLLTKYQLALQAVVNKVSISIAGLQRLCYFLMTVIKQTSPLFCG